MVVEGAPLTKGPSGQGQVSRSKQGPLFPLAPFQYSLLLSALWWFWTRIQFGHSCRRWGKKVLSIPCDNQVLFHAVIIDLLTRLLGRGSISRSFPISRHVAQVRDIGEVQGWTVWSNEPKYNMVTLIVSADFLSSAQWRKAKTEKGARGLVQLGLLSLLTCSPLFANLVMRLHRRTQEVIWIWLDTSHMIRARAPALNITLNYSTDFT